MVLEPPSINNHLEERLNPIQVDQVSDEFIGLGSNNQICKPRGVSTIQYPGNRATSDAHEGFSVYDELVMG
jgi:hypothetical protein